MLRGQNSQNIKKNVLELYLIKLKFLLAVLIIISSLIDKEILFLPE